jgi:hypothetical protein
VDDVAGQSVVNREIPGIKMLGLTRYGKNQEDEDDRCPVFKHNQI